VFGTLAVSVALYHAATEPWGSIGLGETSVARRRLEAECSAARTEGEDKLRLHTAFPGPSQAVTGGRSFAGYADAVATGTPAQGSDQAYKCPIDETTELFRYIATVESCSDAAVVLGASNKKGANKKKCGTNTYTPNTIDVSDAAKATAMTDYIDAWLTAKPICMGARSLTPTEFADLSAAEKTNVLTDQVACQAVTGSALTSGATACEAIVTADATDAATVKACTYTNTAEFTTDWKIAICHLVAGTNRDAPGEEPDTLAKVLVQEMQSWETHDSDANGAKGELDRTDFNKMMSKPIFQWGPFLLYVFCTFYLFCGIAIVCDDFFTASLETLSIKFELSEDVAGATFMAAGSSAPELFTSLSSVIVVDDCANRSSVGVGTIVGSAIFNILVIIGATCMLAGQVLQLGWKPMIRDTCWYALSIALLIIFVLPENVETLKETMGEPGCGDPALGLVKCEKLQDHQYIPFDSTGDGVADTVSSTGLITWWEGLIMWVAYLAYILFMHFNEAILGETADKVSAEEPEDRIRRKSVAGEEEEGADANAAAKDAETGNTTAEKEAAPAADEEEEEDEVDCIGVPKPEELGDKVFTYFSYPWYIFFMLTIPDCESEKWKNWYAASFINSIIWIGVICYGMVEFAILIGQMCDISSTVMGLTVLSAGTSVPDAISSIVVAQRGLGDMAISNALGSNVFDILLGLGFPYFLSALMEGRPVMMCVDDVSVYLACLVIVLIIVVGTFSAFKFALRPIMGIILISTYVLFFLMAVLRDQGALDLGLACDAGH
jgi:Ca2+/Na+ antiporter